MAVSDAAHHVFVDEERIDFSRENTDFVAAVSGRIRLRAVFSCLFERFHQNYCVQTELINKGCPEINTLYLIITRCAN